MRSSADGSEERDATSASTADGGVPVPALRPTRAGDLLAQHGRTRLPLWQYVEQAETAEGDLYGQRCVAVGSALGRLHRRLARHPAASPAPREAALVCDLFGSGHRYAQLIDATPADRS